MFREVYKQANDTIKGDRSVLDRAFLQAAQPVKKKSPIVKYSFIGTAVAAVMVLGAVLLNPTVFTSRSETIGKPIDENPTEKEMVVNTFIATEADLVEDSLEDEAAVDEKVEKTVDTTAEKKVTAKTPVTTKTKTTKPKVSPPDPGGEQTGGTEGDTPQEEYGIMTLGFDGEDEGVYESETEPMITFKMTRPGTGSDEEATEEAEAATEMVSEEVTELVTEEAVEAEEEEADGVNEETPAFSYMYDLSVWSENESTTEGFVNTGVSPVANKDEAIERAENELGKQYNEAMAWYDSIEKIWRVSFKLTGPDGGEVIVYLNSDGITQMMVYPGYYFGE